MLGTPLGYGRRFSERLSVQGKLARSIPRPHWQGTDFTYRFFGEHGRYVQHTYPPHGATFPPYADLQVNKAEAQGIPWPKRHDPPTIPVMEACTRAYEQTRGGTIATAAEQNAKPDGVITYYCWPLWARMDFYGNRPPSRKAEKIQKRHRNTHEFVVEGGDLVLKDRDGDERFEHLHVLADDLPIAIKDIAALG